MYEFRHTDLTGTDFVLVGQALADGSRNVVLASNANYAGGDTIYAGSGTNWLFGEGGNDFIYGSHGRNVIYGGPGNDAISGHYGRGFGGRGAGRGIYHGAQSRREG